MSAINNLPAERYYDTVKKGVPAFNNGLMSSFNAEIAQRHNPHVVIRYKDKLLRLIDVAPTWINELRVDVEAQRSRADRHASSARREKSRAKFYRAKASAAGIIIAERRSELLFAKVLLGVMSFIAGFSTTIILTEKYQWLN